MPKNVITNKDTLEFIEQLESRGYSIDTPIHITEPMRNKESIGGYWITTSKKRSNKLVRLITNREQELLTASFTYFNFIVGKDFSREEVKKILLLLIDSPLKLTKTEKKLFPFSPLFEHIEHYVWTLPNGKTQKFDNPERNFRDVKRREVKNILEVIS